LVAGLLAMLVGAQLSVGSQPAAADPCVITRGGKVGTYVCRYGVTEFTWRGRKHVFVVGTDTANHVYEIWETQPGGPWSNWTSLGGTARSGVDYRTDYGGPGNDVWIRVYGLHNRHYCKLYTIGTARWSPWYGCSATTW
jgi:hypothetical protein